jgi:alkanesulfonate monooxygenase SsuD/methylene tetrahydromethanopterin reductase-like flavin-dependent oxidoreductase (luciferase family)
MTNKLSPAEFRQQWARIATLARDEGRDPARLGSALYHNVHINDDRGAALEESKRFLDAYYSSSFGPAFVEGWTAAGSAERCAADLRAYAEAGVQHIALRFASWDQRGQLERFLAEVAPAL